MRGNPSTIWAQLSLPNPPAGAIPYVFSDNYSIVTSVTNFWFDPINLKLSVAANGDQTGTDSINSYYNQDSYWPWSAAGQPALTANGITAGHTVSSSRGVGTAPQISMSGDFIGKFSGWSYTGTPIASAFYQEVGGMNIYAEGTYSSAAGLGGEVRWFTKQDNGPQVEWIKLTNTGQFCPASNGFTSLGSPGVSGYQWSNLFLSYTIGLTPASTYTINTPLGKVTFNPGVSAVLVANNKVTANTIVQAQLETTGNSTAHHVAAVVPNNGYFQIYLDAAPTTTPVVANFVVWRTDQ